MPACRHAPGAESARQIGFEQDRNAAGQADLPAVGMSAQHQIETDVCGLPVAPAPTRDRTLQTHIS